MRVVTTGHVVKNATLMQDNAIVMMRFDSAQIGQAMSEIAAYDSTGGKRAARVVRTLHTDAGQRP
jgi:uncharacterized protein YbjQ (UPF0145 family)